METTEWLDGEEPEVPEVFEGEAKLKTGGKLKSLFRYPPSVVPL